jgi:hypothetical protein
MIEFETELGDDGVVRVPRPLLKNMGAGGSVIIRLTKGHVSRNLRDRRVSEEEVETISIRQLERREHVIGFLNAEGELANRRPFIRRAQSLLKQ